MKLLSRYSLAQSSGSGLFSCHHEHLFSTFSITSILLSFFIVFLFKPYWITTVNVYTKTVVICELSICVTFLYSLWSHTVFMSNTRVSLIKHNMGVDRHMVRRKDKMNLFIVFCSFYTLFLLSYIELLMFS